MLCPSFSLYLLISTLLTHSLHTVSFTMADLNQSAVDPIANTTGAGFQEAPADDGHKVFAGNLAFATTEDELKSLFSEAGTV